MIPLSQIGRNCKIEVPLTIWIAGWAGTGQADWPQPGKTCRGETQAGKWGTAEPHTQMFWRAMCANLSLGFFPWG